MYKLLVVNDNLNAEMIWFALFQLLFIFSQCNDENEEKKGYDNIREVISKLSKIHENPNLATHRELLEAGILYLDKLEELDIDVKAGVVKAERLIRELHKEGAYDELKKVSFKNLTSHFDWNSMEVAEYENIVHRSREFWNYFLGEVEYGSFGKETTTPQLPPDYDYITDDPDYIFPKYTRPTKSWWF